MKATARRRSIHAGTTSLVVGALALACSGPSAGGGAPSSDPLSDDPGWAALGDWSSIPVLAGGAPRRFSSSDREPYQAFPLTDPGNKDANNFLAVCGEPEPPFLRVVDGDGPCDPGQEGHLIAADDGPGFVARIFVSAGTLPPQLDEIADILIGFADERLVIYTDDDPVPAYEGRLRDWQVGETAPLPGSLTTRTSGAVVGYTPISYREKVRVFLDGLRPSSAYFYQVDTRRTDTAARFDAEATGAYGAAHASTLEAAPGRDARLWSEERVTVAARSARSILSRADGGTLRTLSLAGSATAINDLSLRATWDGSADAAIDLPLSRLFGTAPVPRAYTTLPMSVAVADDVVTLTLRLPMPFESGAELALVNAGDVAHTVATSLSGVDDVPRAPFGRLHASLSEAVAPQAEDARYIAADLTGPGRYAGTVLSFRGTEDPGFTLHDRFNFLEGDEAVFVDGERIAVGTGTEEYLNAGFYFLEGRFDFPFSTLIATDVDPMPDGTPAGRTRGMRWHLLTDSIHFEDSFRLEFEFGANRPATMLQYWSVAYFYR